MTNEVSAKPMHPSNSLPDWERSEQKDSTEHMISDAQITHSEKRKRKEFSLKNQVSNIPKSDDAEYGRTQDEISGRRSKWKNECFHYSVKEGT